MPRLLAIAVGGGALAAALHLSILAGGPGALILAYLTQLPLFLIGFSLGAIPVAAASATAALIVALVTGGMVSFLAFVVTNGAPTLLVTAQALRSRALEDGSRAWYSAGHILAELAAYGSLVIVGLGIIFSGDGGLEAAVNRLLDVAIAQLAAGASAEMRANLVSVMAGILPGAAIAWWLLMVIGNATLAHAVLARFGKALRPKPDYPEIEMPGWTAYVFLAALLMAVVGRGTAFGYVAINMLPVWVLAYGLLGLAAVHALSHRWRQRGLALGALYTALVVLGWPIALVAGFGFIEQWACFRRQFKAPSARRD